MKIEINYYTDKATPGRKLTHHLLAQFSPSEYYPDGFMHTHNWTDSFINLDEIDLFLKAIKILIFERFGDNHDIDVD